MVEDTAEWKAGEAEGREGGSGGLHASAMPPLPMSVMFLYHVCVSSRLNVYLCPFSSSSMPTAIPPYNSARRRHAAFRVRECAIAHCEQIIPMLIRLRHVG